MSGHKRAGLTESEFDIEFDFNDAIVAYAEAKGIDLELAKQQLLRSGSLIKAIQLVGGTVRGELTDGQVIEIVGDTITYISPTDAIGIFEKKTT